MKTPHVYFLLLPITFVTLNGCTPEPAEAQDIPLEEYMELDKKAQNERLTWDEANTFMQFDDWAAGDRTRHFHISYWQIATMPGKDLPDDQLIRSVSQDMATRYNMNRRTAVLRFTCGYIDELHQRE